MDGFLVFGSGQLFCLNEQFSIIAETSFGKTIDEIVQVHDGIRRGVKVAVLTDFIDVLKKQEVKRLFVESPILADEFSRLYEAKVQHYEDLRLWRRVRQEFLSLKMASKEEQVLHEISVGIARLAIREAAEASDQVVIQAMNSLDDVEKVQNLMVSRLREWYGLHFPEAAHAIESGLVLSRIIVEGGSRTQINNNPELMKLVTDSSVKTELISQSMGAEISDQDMVMIQSLANHVLSLQEFRERLEKYLDESMQVLAPNIRGLIGPVIGARLIGLAGGMEKLARFPASTIQVLGAEQALFRALKTGARPPKHGVIFQHTLVHSAPWWQRGKIARILAGKIAIAARIDFYSGQYVADELKQTVQSRVAEVKRKYPTAPKTQPTKPKKHPPRRKRYGKRTKPHAPKKRGRNSRRKQS